MPNVKQHPNVVVGDRIRQTAFNGHSMMYRVARIGEDGYLHTTQFDAYCANSCRACAGGEQLPDW